MTKPSFKTARDLRRAYDLSDDCLARLVVYAELLAKWQKTINLVAPSTLPDLWERHFLDSLQVSEAVPDTKVWADLGSGGGFPGLVTAIRLVDVPDAKVHLIESDQRKCAFLRTVSRETGAPAEIHAGRIEAVLEALPEKLDAVSARGLASLPELIALAEKPLENGAIGVFPQGRNAHSELTGTRFENRFLIETRKSATSPDSWLAIIRAHSNS